MTTLYRYWLSVAVMSLGLLAGSAQAQVTGDAVRGKTAFAACGVCHAVVAGKTGVGPSLFGVVGREAGTSPGFTRYSAAMKGAGKWTPEKLEAFLADPKKTVPGNTMPFAGLKDAQRRADIVAYLKTAK